MPARPLFARAFALAVAVSAISATLGLASTSCRRRPAPPASSKTKRGDRAVVLAGPSQEYVLVEPAKAARTEGSRALVARVSYDERHVARLGAPVNGRVSSVGVVTGDVVKPGAILLTLSAPDIASAQAQVAQAKTARALAERSAERARTLAREGAGSDAERLQAEAALGQATSEELRATAALAAIGGASGPTGYQLRSPIAGTVVERNVSVGTQVHIDQDRPLVTVGDLSSVWIVADVYEQDLARVAVGDAATIRVLAYPGRRFEGRIAHVGDVVDPRTRSVLARVELANRDLALRPGMFATMDVRGRAEGVAEVPASAVLAKRDQFYVFVHTDAGVYAQREVTLGEQRGMHITVLEGIREGDPVVVDGAILLAAELDEGL